MRMRMRTKLLLIFLFSSFLQPDFAKLPEDDMNTGLTSDHVSTDDSSSRPTSDQIAIEDATTTRPTSDADTTTDDYDNEPPFTYDPSDFRFGFKDGGWNDYDITIEPDLEKLIAKELNLISTKQIMLPIMPPSGTVPDLKNITEFENVSMWSNGTSDNNAKMNISFESATKSTALNGPSFGIMNSSIKGKDLSKYVWNTSDYVWYCGSPTILVIGTLGNVLSLVVMFRKKIRSSTTSLYLRVLAVLDLIILYTGLLQLYIKHVTSGADTSGADIRLTSRAACKLQMFYGYFILQFNSWLIMTVTLERLFAVICPHQWKKMFNKKNACVGIFLKALLIAILNGHFLFTHDLLVLSPTHKICRASTSGSVHFMLNVWPWIDFIVCCLIPSIVILISNLIIIANVVLSRVKHQQPNPTNQTKLTSLTIVLILVSLTFFFTTSPIAIYLINNRVNSEAEEKEKLNWAILNLIMYVNNSANFFLYVIGGPRFRNEFIKLFTRRNRISPDNTLQLNNINS